MNRVCLFPVHISNELVFTQVSGSVLGKLLEEYIFYCRSGENKNLFFLKNTQLMSILLFTLFQQWEYNFNDERIFRCL